ncbi:MAG: hypothetical protein AAF620_12445 [Bacteroidota bacterium]
MNEKVKGVVLKVELLDFSVRSGRTPRAKYEIRASIRITGSTTIFSKSTF